MCSSLTSAATHRDRSDTTYIHINKQRFKRGTEEDIQNIQDCRQSESTKNKTKWAIKVVQGTYMLLAVQIQDDIFLKVQMKRLHNKILK